MSSKRLVANVVALGLCALTSVILLAAYSEQGVDAQTVWDSYGKSGDSSNSYSADPGLPSSSPAAPTTVPGSMPGNGMPTQTPRPAVGTPVPAVVVPGKGTTAGKKSSGSLPPGRPSSRTIAAPKTEAKSLKSQSSPPKSAVGAGAGASISKPSSANVKK